MLIKLKPFQVSILLAFICVLLAIGSLASDVMAAKDIIMEEDFEATNWAGKWSLTGNPHWYRQYYSVESCIPSLPGGGLRNAWNAEQGDPDLDACDDEYPNNSDSWMIYGPFDLSDLSGPIGEAKIEFYLWNKSGTGDYFRFMASTKRTPVSAFQTLYETQSEIGWEHIKLALDGGTGSDIDNNVGNPDFRGQPKVWIAFVFQSNGSGTNTGAFIDNIELWKQIEDIIEIPDIDVTPASWDYGDVLKDSTANKTFTIKNVGNAVLHVEQVTILGGDADQFAISDPSGDPIPTFELAPGATKNVIVSFSPTSVGLKESNLRCISDDPENPTLDVPLTGTGTLPPFQAKPTNKFMYF